MKLPDNVLPALDDLSHSARSAWIETVFNGDEAERPLVALRKECVD